MSEIWLLLKFFMMVFGFYLDERKKAEAKKEKYELSETEILNLSSMALQRLREVAAREALLAKQAENALEKSVSEDIRKTADQEASRSNGTAPESNEDEGPGKSEKKKQ